MAARSSILALLLTILWFTESPAWAQEGSFNLRVTLESGANADQIAADLEEAGYYPVTVETHAGAAHLAVGRFTQRGHAEAARVSLAEEGFLQVTVQGTSIAAPLPSITPSAQTSTTTGQRPRSDRPRWAVDRNLEAELPPPVQSGAPFWLLLAVGAVGILILAAVAWIAAQRSTPRGIPAPAGTRPALRVGVRTPVALSNDRIAEVIPLSTPPPLRTPKPLVLTPPSVVPGAEEVSKRKRLAVPRAPVPLFSDGLDQVRIGDDPPGWSAPDSDTATLVVTAARERGPVLEYEKFAAGVGGLAFCALPECRGELLVEFDLVCHEKNSYLLGVYLQEGQDFRRSIQTQVQTTPRGGARVRLHGADAPVSWGEWVRICYELDLQSSRVVAYMNGARVGDSMELTQSPQFIDTLVIRTAPETIGRLGLGRIRVWSGKELRAHVVNTPLLV